MHVLQQLTTEPVTVYMPAKVCLVQMQLRVGPPAHTGALVAARALDRPHADARARGQQGAGVCTHRAAHRRHLRVSARHPATLAPSAPQVVKNNWYGFLSWMGNMEGVIWKDVDEYDQVTTYDLVSNDLPSHPDSVQVRTRLVATG